MNVIPPQSELLRPTQRQGGLPTSWQILHSSPADGHTNMAVDRALLRHTATVPYGVWRCYAWDRPTVSFGRHEQVRERFTPASLAAAGLDAVRRPTGGRALLHHREVTYSTTFALDAEIPWRVAYAAVNAVLLTALRSLGIPVELVGRDGRVAVRPDGPVCFDEPAEGEITLGGRKLVGSAVWRDHGAYLQHGSILLHDDQALLAQGAACPLPVPPPAASLYSVDGPELTWQNVVDVCTDTLSQTGAVTPFAPPALFADQVEATRADFARNDWLWRR